MMMRFSMIVGAAAVIAPAPAVAEHFLSLPEAQALIFPGATFEPNDITLTDEQVTLLEKVSGAPVYRPLVKAWRTSTGGWLLIDQVPGRDDRITYAVGLDASGSIVGIEIMVCLAEYGGIRHPAWRQQFVGVGQPGPASRISNISGTTMSVDHLQEGVRRVLATHTLFLNPS
jgi:hypothetical protein